MNNNDYYKQLQQLSYSVYPSEKYPVPEGWASIKKYENKETGFYAEAFMSPKGEVFLVPRATQSGQDTGVDVKDFENDWQLCNYEIPDQFSDMLEAYNDITSIYGDDIKTTGYSLGGTLSAMLSNETGIEAVTFEAYGVGGFVPAKHTDNIINFGHEKDPIFIRELDGHLGKVYIIPQDENTTELYPSEETAKVNPRDVKRYHAPYKSGDLDKAIEYVGPSKVLNGSVYYEDLDDSIFNYKNRVYYNKDYVPIHEMTSEAVDEFWDQAFEPGGLPTKEDLDARCMTGELIYVEDYTRSDGTKVSGYYRKCQQ